MKHRLNQRQRSQLRDDADGSAGDVPRLGDHSHCKTRDPQCPEMGLGGQPALLFME